MDRDITNIDYEHLLSNVHGACVQRFSPSTLGSPLSSMKERLVIVRELVIEEVQTQITLNRLIKH